MPIMRDLEPGVEFNASGWNNGIKLGRINNNGFRREIDSNPEAETLAFYNKKGEREFVVEWGVVKEEDRKGKIIRFFSIRQTHFVDGEAEVIKIVKAPLSIDMEKVSEILLSNPPRSKNPQTGRLNIPWKEIGTVVGASLSYSRLLLH